MKTRQAGVKAKLADLIEEAEHTADLNARFARELRKLKPEDFTSIKDLITRGYSPAFLAANTATCDAMDAREERS